jgi:hypothetical protein
MSSRLSRLGRTNAFYASLPHLIGSARAPTGPPPTHTPIQQVLSSMGNAQVEAAGKAPSGTGPASTDGSPQGNPNYATSTPGMHLLSRRIQGILGKQPGIYSPQPLTTPQGGGARGKLAMDRLRSQFGQQDPRAIYQKLPPDVADLAARYGSL